MLFNIKDFMSRKSKKEESLLNSDDLYKLDYICKHEKLNRREVLASLINKKYNSIDKVEIIERDELLEEFLNRLDKSLAETLSNDNTNIVTKNKSIIWCNSIKYDMGYIEYKQLMVDKLKELFVIPTVNALDEFKHIRTSKEIVVKRIKEVTEKYGY